MEESVLGAGDQRDRRQDAGGAQGLRSRLGLLARLRQVQQRTVLSVPQVLRVLGLQQRRPPGAHLPLHHGRGRREHVGLRRDDQFLQRHAQLETDDPVRLQSGRGASGFRAAHPARQGSQQVEADRLRSALYAHRGACRRIRALPSRHRRRAGVGHSLPHPEERLGRQGIHQRARLRHGRHAQGSHEVDAGGDREGHRRARRAARTRRQDDARKPSRHAGLVHGRHAAHQRQQQHARLLRAAAGARQHRCAGRWRQHLPRPRQRARRHRRVPARRQPARLLRPGDRFVEALGARLGRRLRLSEGPFCLAEADGDARASRCRAGSMACSRKKRTWTSPTTSA